MTSLQMKPFRVGAALLVAALGSTAGAQVSSYPPGAVVQPLESDASQDLARHIRDLADNPRSLTSLIGAGNAALEMGDPQTALTFFARAEEVAPRDGRVKAGMGSAFVQTEQAEAALKFFADAEALGVSEGYFAKDRGLAYDMLGDPARAQADYALVLRMGNDPETQRRMALSMAIGSNREGALALLEPQIAVQDQAAWRARAFVLALTGDTAEAVKAADAVLSGAQAAAMRPFLERLPQLTLAERAMAVHFGRFPDRVRDAIANGETRYAAADRRPTAAGRPDVRQPALGRGRTSSRPRAPAQEGKKLAVGRRVIVAADDDPGPRPVEIALAPPPVAVAAPAPAPIASAELEPSEAALPPAEAEPEEAPKIGPPRPHTQTLDFADVAATIRALPGNPFDAEVESDAEAEVAPAPAPEAAQTPARIWVQLAAAANISAFPWEFGRIKRKAPDLLSDKTAWTAPLGSINRLLVGPFGTEKEARDLVNALAELEIDSLSWTSDAGQEIEKLPAK